MVLALWLRLGVGVGLGALLAYLSTPVAIQAAHRFSFYDVPVGYKGHRRPTPYLGGASLMLAFAFAAVIGAGEPSKTLPVLVGVLMLWFVGTIDDRVTVTPLLRVIVELGVATIVSASGLGWHLGAGGVVDAAITAIWVVGVVNAFNLFDNMDGQASTMAAVVSAGACVLALFTGATWAAAASAALAGACLGFLPHNLASPAKIFLGDGGSMPLGFAVSVVVAAAASSSEASTLSLVVGLLMVGVPALDTCLVIVSRRRRGISVLTGGQDHVTHRTRRRMVSAARVALVLGSAQALISALVVFATQGTPITVVYLALGFVVLAAATIGGFETAYGPEPALRTAGTQSRSAYGRTQAADRGGLVALGLLGLGAGLSPLFQAYYGNAVWQPIALVLVIAAGATAVARPVVLPRPAMLAFAALAGLGLFSLISTLWTPAVEQATIDANRWLAYAAMLLVALLLVRSRRHATVLVCAVGVGMLGVAVILVGHLLGPGASRLFISGRLNWPLGYINGEGCAFAMACWPAVAAAERRQPLLAAAGAGLATVLVGLALFSESRGTALAAAVTVLLVVASVPGRRRRILVLATIGLAAAIAGGAILRVYTSGSAGAPTDGAVHSATIRLLLCGFAAAIVWGSVVAFEQALRRSRATAPAQVRRVGTVAVIVILAVPILGAVVKAGSISHTVTTQWHQFVNVSDSPPGPAATTTGSQSRLLTGSGNRYDYWRIAWKLFEGNPVAGAGAGGYTATYFRQRRTTEAIQNPHSIELELLSELGLVGTSLLALIIGAVVLAVRRLARRARGELDARALVVAGTGILLTWLVATSGDWMHLLPGVSAMALLAAAAVLGCAPESTSHASGRARAASVPVIRRVLAASAVGIVLAVAGASLLRSGLTQIYVNSAQSELRDHPAAALTDANRALRLDHSDLDGYYLLAAAQARFNQASTARATLLAATRVQADNFVTWVLLGDLEVRAGHLGAAREYYGRAHGLVPNDPSITALAANPLRALASTG